MNKLVTTAALIIFISSTTGCLTVPSQSTTDTNAKTPAKVTTQTDEKKEYSAGKMILGYALGVAVGTAIAKAITK